MEIKLYVHLRDDTGDVGGFKTFTFGATSTVDDLMGQIRDVFHIPLQHQEVYLVRAGTETKNETLEQLKSGTLQEVKVTNKSNIYVKHADLPQYLQYKACVENAKKLKGEEQTSNAEDAIKLHMRLMESGFFDVYISFNAFRLENQHGIASLADGSLILMKKAVKSHFRAQHYKLKDAKDESDFICHFEPRPDDCGGSRINTLAFVRLHGEEKVTKYNVKCHHYGATSARPKGMPLQIREFYIYKLLELIDVGPHSQFILPNKCAGSKTSMYIATKWNDDFVSIKEEENVSVEVLVQLLLLAAFLFINDLNQDNCGHWKGTKDAAIVDFDPSTYTDTNIESKTLDDVLSALDDAVYFGALRDVHITTLKKFEPAERLEMAKKCLKKWDLLSKIDMANKQIMTEKNRMKEEGLDFKKSPTEELDRYISAIKKNFQRVAEILNAQC